MKNLILAFLFITTSTFYLSAQNKEQTCHFGITFEISNNPNWGYGEPVVLSVEPYSPAEKAGIKVGDIIMEVNSTATYLRDYRTIAAWLFDSTEDNTYFTIRNLNTYFKEYKLNRQCNEVGSLSESDLATSFSFYSLEDTNERSFVLPAQVTTNENVDYSDYHTFDFITEPGVPEIDSQITSIIEKNLRDRGLTRDTEDPDIIIQTYYSYQPNPKYNAARSISQSKTWRYDPNDQKMILVPFLSGDNKEAGFEGRYMMELGIRFFDKKYIDPEKLTQIWDCRAIEYLSDEYSLAEYTRIHTPLLMMNFPYSDNKISIRYVVSYMKYNYTGIHISSDDMKTITNVDQGSPAYLSGIRSGDILKKVQNSKFNVTNDELTNAYKRFIIETMKYRDVNTRFTDANGFTDCMFWDKYQYDQIAKEFKNNIYLPNFSYLYNFNRYVSTNASDRISFETQSRNQKKSYTIVPEVRSSVRVQIK